MNRASSLFGGLAAIAIAIVFVVSFQPGGGSNQSIDGPECAAEVLGRCVKGSHFWATYRMVAGGSQQQDGELDRFKKQVLDGLVERELLLAEAKRLGISISEEELTKELTSGRVRISLPANLLANRQVPHSIVPIGERFIDRKTKKYSPEAYKKAVGEVTRLSQQDFRDFQRAELTAERMRDLIMSRVRVSDGEAYDAYAERETTAKVKYVKFSPQFYVGHGVDRSPAAVDAWAVKNAGDIDKDFESRKANLAEGCREISQILIAIDPDAPDTADKAAREKIDAAKKRIEAGESFADVARDVSDDTVSAQSGGRLSCITKADAMGKLAAFSEPIFGAKEPGLIAEPIESPRGLHLLNLDRILTGEDAEKAMRAAIARDRYLAVESRRLAGEAANEVQAAVKDGKSLEEALKVHLAKLPGAPTKAPAPQEDEPAKDGEPKKDAPKTDAPKTDAPKTDEPAKDADPSKDEPKTDEPKTDEPKTDEPKTDEPAEDASEVVDPFAPKVESSFSFTVTEEPFPDAEAAESPAAVAFGLDKPGDVAERIIPLKGGGLLVMVLENKEAPTEEDWQKERAVNLDELRRDRQLEALVSYVQRLRTTHKTEIKEDPDFFPKPADSGKPDGSASKPPTPAPPQ